MNRRTRLRFWFFENIVQPVAVRAIMLRERLRTGVAFNPLDKAFRTNPYPMYQALRERDPAHETSLISGWVLSRYRDVSAVLRDNRFFADDRKLSTFDKQRQQMMRQGLVDEGEEMTESMLRMDPPDHTRLRSLVSKAFTPRTVEALRPRVEGIVHEHLDRVANNGGMELIEDLAYPLPVIVIAEMLGVPIEDRERFKRWSDEAVRSLGSNNVGDFVRSRDAARELRAYFEQVAEERRREPREDLLSALLAAEEEGDKLSLDEVYATCILLLIAGNETTTNLIGNGTLALLRHPEQLELLRKNPDLIEGAVEELLRYDSPVQMTGRFALERVEMDGFVMEPEQQAFVLLGSANRDPEQFTEPDRLNITRKENKHLSFGNGIHFCLGAPLARLESQVAFLALLERFPNMRLVGKQVSWRDNVILRGPERVPLAL